MSGKQLSNAAHFRMIRLYITLSRLDKNWTETVMTSSELGEFTSSSAEIVRKDLSNIGCGSDGRGYRVKTLTRDLKEKLHLIQTLNTGLIGLDSWGQILIKEEFGIQGLKIIAAFDGNQNRLERTESRIPLYPSHEIEDIFEREKISVGILASENAQSEKNLERMLKGGVKGIINLTSASLNVPDTIHYYQADLELGFLSVISRINGVEKK